LDQPDDAAAMARMRLTPGQFSNLKRHLYQQLLTSLRLIFINKEIDIELREQIDFTRILYGKGHYLDALRTLERAKTKAVEHSQDLLHLEILEFQKLIEARHVTLSRQVDNKMDLLLNESAARSYSVLNTSELFNLNIQIHGRYIESGHSRNTEQAVKNEAYWKKIQTIRADRETVASTFHQKINRFQSTMWYHYIQLHLDDALESALNAINLFQLSRQMIVKDPDLYLRCLYYVNVFGYLTGREAEVKKPMLSLQAFLSAEKVQLNENSRRVGRIYQYLATYNYYFLTGKAEAAYTLKQEIDSAHQKQEFTPNQQRWGLFLYKAGAACFLTQRYDETLDHLNDIINMRGGILREDLLINTRLLHAICNYELGHHSLVDYHLTSLGRLLKKSRETAEIHLATVSALRKLIKTPPSERTPIYGQLYAELNQFRNSPFEAKAITYLDIRVWLKIHLEIPVEA
ncbi:MAG: hypothetical protein AAGA31_12125, partial [Bacteroidota bacterium]